MNRLDQESPEEFVARWSDYDFGQIVAEAIERAADDVRAGHAERGTSSGSDVTLGAARALGDLFGPLREAVANRIAREQNVDADAVKKGLVDRVLERAFPLEPASLIDRTMGLLLRDGHVDALCEAVGLQDAGSVDALQHLADRLIETFGGLAVKIQAHVQENGWKGCAQVIPKGKAGGDVWCDLAGELAWRYRVERRGRGELELAKKLRDPLPIFIREVRRVAAEIPCPPLTSAHNIEVAAMGAAHLFGSFEIPGDPVGASLEPVMQTLSTRPEEFGKVHRAISDLYRILARGGDDEGLLLKFILTWRRCGFAKLEIGHKLAANLCLTDVPDDLAVHPPWKAWSLIVPNGLFGDDVVSRLWIFSDNGDVRVNPIGKSGPLEISKLGSIAEMCRSLALGASLALSNPDDFQKQSRHDSSGTPGTIRRRRHGEPDFNQARFLLSAPVKIDLRTHVREIAEGCGRKGASPKVQFIVRGHWRQQACGPGRSLRKPIWIQAFWKGPEESRVLLRHAQIDGAKE